MARAYGAGRLTVFRRVVLPASVPAIFVGLRLSATTALLLLIAAEMIGANKGVGFQVMNAQYNFQIPLMFAAILLLALLGLAANALLVLLQRRLCRWSESRPDLHRFNPIPISRKDIHDHDPSILASCCSAAAIASRSRRLRLAAEDGHDPLPRQPGRSCRPTNWPHELGYFEGTGITLENVGYATGGPASLIALASGDVELGSAATAAVLNSIAGGNDFVAAYPSNGINDEVQIDLLRAGRQPDQDDQGHRRQDHRRQHARRASRLHGARGAAFGTACRRMRPTWSSCPVRSSSRCCARARWTSPPSATGRRPSRVLRAQEWRHPRGLR